MNCYRVWTSLLGITITLLVLCSFSHATALQITGSDSTMDLRSVKVKKAELLAITDIESKLPITVLTDTISGLIVLSSSCNTVPVYCMDEKEYLHTDSGDYLSVDLVAQALCCSWKVGKKGIQLNPLGEPVSYHKVGLSEGDFAPGFQLQKSDSSVFSSRDLLPQGPLIVLFIRSADWDPATIALLKTLESKMDSIKAAGATLVGIHGYDRKKSRKWEQDFKLSFPLLVDRSASVMRVYGVFDKGNLPFSAAIVVGRTGKILAREVMENRAQVPDVGDIMRALVQ